MIATIAKVPVVTFLRTVQYNEMKVREGEADRLINSTLEEEPVEMVDTFKEQLERNPLVRKNQIAKIVLSFSPDDTAKLDLDLLKETAHEVFNSMGYEGSLLAYYHTDTAHPHLHLYSTTVDVQGQKIKEYDDYAKLELIMRQTELKHGLKVVQEDQSTNISLGEVQAKEYAIHQALTTKPDFYQKALKFIRKDTLNELIERPKSNAIILDRVGAEFGKEAHEKFKSLFSQSERKALYKELLVHKLDQHLTLAKSKEDYYKRLANNNLYSRIVYNKKGQPGLVYGLKDSAFYLNQNKLPVRFQLNRVNQIGKAPDPVAKERKQQRQFLKNQIYKSLRVSCTFHQLENSLYLNGVRLITHENTNGIYGVSFESLNISNPITFKGSEIDRSLSFNKIRDRILKNSPVFDSTFYDQVAHAVKDKKQKSITQPKVTKIRKLGKGLETDQEQEEKARRAGREF